MSEQSPAAHPSAPQMEPQQAPLQGLRVSDGYKVEQTSITQVNFMDDGRSFAGDYPDAAIQATIHGRDSMREAAEKRFRAVVDQENNNYLYPSELRLVRSYFASKGLHINPLRVVDNEAIDKAYAATEGRDKRNPEGDQGRNINGRSLIYEDQATIDIFGSDYILSIGLHEAAHSLSGNRLIRAVKQNAGRVVLGGYKAGGLTKADLRPNTASSIVGEFWEEALADLTRVKALRELGRSNDFSGGSREVAMSESTVLVTANNGDRSKQLTDDGTIVMPAEYAVAAKTSDTHGRNMVALTHTNFAAYALDLLDQRVPGLYDDLLDATQDPKKQAAAIRKIESVKSGLYRQLRDLDYTEKDFTQGLRYVIDAFNSD